MGFSRRKVAFPELVARFRANHPGLTFNQAVRELSQRSARKRHAQAEQRKQTDGARRWWEN